MTSRLRDLAVKDGLELVGIVRDYGLDTITEFVRQRDRHQLEAMAVALAAMVPDDQPVSALLAWIEPEHVDRSRPSKAGRKPPRELRPCGTHAAFVRHKAAGQDPCGSCQGAERIYQRGRKRLARQVA